MNGHEPPQPPPGRAKIIAVRVVVVAITVCTILLLPWVPVLRVAIMRRRKVDWALFWIVLVVSFFNLSRINGAESWTADDQVKAGAISLVCTGIWSIWYYLRFDIRHYRELETRFAVAQALAAEREAAAHRQAVAHNEAALAEAVKASLFAPGPEPVATPEATLVPPAPPAPPAPRVDDPFADTRSYVRMPQPAPRPQAGPAPVPAPFQAPPPPSQRVGRHRRPPEHAAPGAPTPPPRPRRIHEVRAELDELSDLLRKEPKDGPQGGRKEQEW
ncbi:hypothetical protein AB0C81_17115 [Streptomyces roseoverticillatus]|uniref:hypothetical protein n=1 Tax=Streptomyces roseoverticillatus TaxID=66429 RepID=UPI0033DD1BBD